MTTRLDLARNLYLRGIRDSVVMTSSFFATSSAPAKLLPALLAASLIVGACATDSGETAETTATTATSTTTTTTPTTAAPTATEAPATTSAGIVNEAEAGLRFDYGEISRVEAFDSVTWIFFDRYKFGDQQGVELHEEPRWEMATDWHGGGNVNPRLRAYPLASGVQTLEIDPEDFINACADLNLPWEFIETDVQSIAALDGMVSLTFDAELQVTLIRDQRTC